MFAENRTERKSTTSIVSDLLIHIVGVLGEKLSSAIDFDSIIAGLSSEGGSSAADTADAATTATTTATATPAPAAQ